MIYGRKWIQHMNTTLASTDESEWTEGLLEAAFLKASQYAGASECTWPLDTKTSTKTAVGR